LVDNQDKHFFPLPSAAINLQTEVVDRGPSSSKNLKVDSISLAIDYNADEAIDTFKKLSQEIDFIKTTGFRQSVSEAHFRPKNPAPRPKFTSLSHPFNTALKEVGPKSVSAQEINKPFGKQSEARHLTDNHFSGNLSLTSEAVDKERKQKEKKEERNELFDEKRTRTNVSCHLLIDDSKVKNKDFDQNNHLKKFSFSKTQLDQNNEEIETDKRRQENFTTAHAANAVINNIAIDSAKMSVSAESTSITSGNSTRFRKMSSAQRKEKLRQVVLRHRSNPNISDSENSLLSDASSNASDIDMEWLEEGVRCSQFYL